MVLATARQHRVTEVSNARADRRSEVPARKHACKFIYICLRVRSNRVALRVAYGRTVKVEHVGADRKELEHLARKVLVRICSRAETHIEILTHRRCECDLVQQGSIIAKSVSIESLQVRRHPARAIDLAIS